MQTTNGGHAIGRGIQLMVGFAYNNISLPLALIKLNIKHLVVLFTIQVLSIKAEIIFVLQELGRHGLQHPITAHNYLQPVKLQHKVKL